MEEQPLDKQIDALLMQAQVGDDRTQEWARMHLELFREDCGRALLWKRTEGRALVLAGDEPEWVRETTEARINEARRKLRDRLTSLLAWSRENPM